MNAYVVADQRWAFGRNGGLLFSLPADLDRFHSLTQNGTVIMGPERLEFFTGGTPLPQRRNIIVTRNPSLLPEGTEGKLHAAPGGGCAIRALTAPVTGRKTFRGIDGQRDQLLLGMGISILCGRRVQGTSVFSAVGAFMASRLEK